MNVGICTMEKFDNRLPNTVGSSRIRGRNLIKYWPDAEEYQIGKKYDVMIFQKVYWKEMMKTFEGIKILDICDPDWFEGRPVLEFIDLMDATVTSTEALRDYILKFRPKANVVCIPDRMDLEEFKLKKEKHQGRAKSIVWFGYNHNIHYLYKTFEQIIQKGLELTIVSDQPFTPPMSYQNLKVKNIPYSYPGVHNEIIKHDMVLLPLPTDDLKGSFKSNNKVVEAWALGMPVVVMPEDLDRFMDAEERNKEVELRLKEVEGKYNVKLSVEEYKKLLDNIVTQKQGA